MKFAAIIDIGAFIWDKAQFDQDQSLFYPILDSMPSILNIIVSERIPVVFRNEFFKEIKLYFPFGSIPHQYKDYHRTTLGQLTKLNIIDYPSSANAAITCNPSLIKTYFANTTQQEIWYLINHLYNENERVQKILTFSVLWQGGKNVVIKNGNSRRIATQICDDKGIHTSIIRSLKKIFEHNPKHRAVQRFFNGKKISPFRFFNPRKPNTIKAQELLDKAVYVQGGYYSKDFDTSIYVRFLKTEKNLFHGFEVSPSSILQEDIEIALKNG